MASYTVEIFRTHWKLSGQTGIDLAIRKVLRICSSSSKPRTFLSTLKSTVILLNGRILPCGVVALVKGHRAAFKADLFFH